MCPVNNYSKVDVCSDPLKRATISLTNPKVKKNYHFDSVKVLLQTAETYIQKPKLRNKKREPIKLPDVRNKVFTEQDLISHWLKNYQVFCIGEPHESHASKEFLVDNMAYLKEKDVKVIFMEGLFDDLQNDLDTYFEGQPLSVGLLKDINGMDSNYNFNLPYGYRGIIEAANREGIRIVGIDTNAALHDCQSRDGRDKRSIALNYFAYKMIKQTMKELGNGKCVVLIGTGHLRMRANYIPGVTTLLSCPDMIIADSDKEHLPSVQFNATPYIYFPEVKTDILYYRMPMFS